MMEYKGFVARVTFDDSVSAFHGRVVNTRDVITFEGQSVKELKKEFRNSVNDYLEFCKKKRVNPDKPYSGEFRLRLDPDLHRSLSLAAEAEGDSLNSYIVKHLAESVQTQATR